MRRRQLLLLAVLLSACRSRGTPGSGAEQTARTVGSSDAERAGPVERTGSAAVGSVSVSAPALVEGAAEAIGGVTLAAGRTEAESLLDARPADVFMPPTRPTVSRPVLLLLHGYGASAEVVARVFDVQAFAAAHGAIVLVPQGTKDHLGRRFWNASASCCNFDRLAVDDVAYIDALVQRTLAMPKVDASRVYAIGFSNGAFLVQRLACQATTPFAAVVSVAGAALETGARCNPKVPLALLHVHGDRDSVVPYEGGRLLQRDDVPRVVSAHATVSQWAQWLQASGPSLGEPLDVEPNLPGAETTVERWAHPSRGSVVLWTVHGGGHGVTLHRAGLEALWAFLSAHARP